jgi:hypothetical protein
MGFFTLYFKKECARCRRLLLVFSSLSFDVFVVSFFCLHIHQAELLLKCFVLSLKLLDFGLERIIMVRLKRFMRFWLVAPPPPGFLAAAPLEQQQVPTLSMLAPPCRAMDKHLDQQWHGT